MSSYQSGLDRLLTEEMHVIEGKRIGLVTNHTGVTQAMQSNVDVLHGRADVTVTALFAPEHGVRGSVQAGGAVEDQVDERTGIPVYSVYGKTRKPTAAMLADVDVLVYDIQDVGVRYYTYISTMLHAMEACAEHGKPFVVLDRLNPIGRRVEGNILEDGFQSFVGAYPMTLRHGLTLGELASWVNDAYEINAQLTIVKCSGWSGEFADELNLQWVPPSPNIPSFISALVYPITCLFEGTNLSEGRGTANPFEYIGAPWVDPYDAVEVLNTASLPGVLFRPIYFVPTFSKHAGEECGGVQVIVTDRQAVDSCLTGLTLLKCLQDLYPEQTQWRTRSGDTGILAIDRLMGTDKVRHGLDAKRQPEAILADWYEDAKSFAAMQKQYWLY